MDITKFDNQIRSVKQRIRNLNSGTSTGACYSAFFTKNNLKDCILNRITIKSIGLIRKNAVIEEPDIIRIEIFESDKSKKILWIQTLDLRDDIDLLKPQNSEKESFSGLGEAQINQLVENKIVEIKRQESYENLQKEVVSLKDDNEFLLKQIEEEQQKVIEAEVKIEELEHIIQTKSSIKYYAGIVGDILEGLGIPKDKISKPIASLMGFDEKETESKKLAENEDTSGIVDENEENEESENQHQESDNQSKRQEIVEVISAYLHTVSNETLSQLFTLFSEIESKPAIVKELIENAKSLKKQ